MRILILGGTAEGRALASVLAAGSHEVVTSLAGVTAAPALVAGEVRTGGFGGAGGLATWLREHRVDAVVDATHPFAARMSAHAAEACGSAGVRLLRLSRPGWCTRPDADRWRWVDGLAAAADAASESPGTILLTVGRQGLDAFRTLAGRRVVARVADGAGLSVPDGWTLVADRGPFEAESERRLFERSGVAVLVSKDSGGDHTSAKLDVAAERGVRVVMVRRPQPPEGVPIVRDVRGVLAWLDG